MQRGRGNNAGGYAAPGQGFVPPNSMGQGTGKHRVSWNKQKEQRQKQRTTKTRNKDDSLAVRFY